MAEEPKLQTNQEPKLQTEKKPINWFKYAVAWIKYCGEFLIRLAGVGDVIRNSFSDISIPKKDDY